jgi:hypothetical protein
MAEMAVGMGPNFIEVMWTNGLELGVRGLDPSTLRQPIEVAALPPAGALARRAVITKLRSRFRELSRGSAPPCLPGGLQTPSPSFIGRLAQNPGPDLTD